MDSKQRMEQFSIAYVHAIASRVGLNKAHPSVDDDSVDMILRGRGFPGKLRSPQIELQLKCTSQDLINDDQLSFPLSIKNYNDLRGDDVICPRYLIVLLVPKEIDDWLEHEDDALLLKHSCYWTSIKDHPVTSNTTSVTINIPLEQKLTCDSLLALMTAAATGA